MTCMLGPVLITYGLHGAPWLPYSFPPHLLSPLLWGGGGGDRPCCPGAALGWGLSSGSSCAADTAAIAPSAPPLEGWDPVGPNLSHHKARVQAVGWAPVGDQ